MPGCVATGANIVEVKQNIIDAIALHVKGSLQDGDAIPGIFKKEYHFIYKFDIESL